MFTPLVIRAHSQNSVTGYGIKREARERSKIKQKHTTHAQRNKINHRQKKNSSKRERGREQTQTTSITQQLKKK